MDPFAPSNHIEELKESQDINLALHQSVKEEGFFDNLRSRLKEKAEEVFGREVKNLSLSAHKWMPGAYASDHYDNAELDGTPNA